MFNPRRRFFLIALALLLAAVGHPRVKMVLDTYHLGQDGVLPDRIAAAAPSGREASSGPSAVSQANSVISSVATLM